jgi:hypothetical protein
MPDILNSSQQSTPATHALVIGVSRYHHIQDGQAPTERGRQFGLEQLTSAARSASEVASWLLNSYRNARAPLGSLRVLLSPSPGEVIASDVAERLSSPHGATRAAVEQELAAFRTACAQHVDNVAFVYVAGHGVQLTNHGAILLLEDVGSDAHLNELGGALDVVGCHQGFDHPRTARTQFWFFDACRQVPEVARRFANLAGAITLDEQHGHADSSPLFLASSTREVAFARVGQSSLFCEALVWALQRGAVRGPGEECGEWHVSVSSLHEKLAPRVRLLAGQAGEDQNVEITGRVLPAIIHRLAEPPRVKLQVTLQPPAAQPVTRASLFFGAQRLVLDRHAAWPIDAELEAGLYLLDVTTAPPYADKKAILDLKPPAVTEDVKVA